MQRTSNLPNSFLTRSAAAPTLVGEETSRETVMIFGAGRPAAEAAARRMGGMEERDERAPIAIWDAPD